MLLGVYLLFALHAVFHLWCTCVCLCVLHVFGSDASRSVNVKLARHGHHGNGIVETIIANHFGNATLSSECHLCMLFTYQLPFCLPAIWVLLVLSAHVLCMFVLWLWVAWWHQRYFRSRAAVVAVVCILLEVVVVIFCVSWCGLAWVWKLLIFFAWIYSHTLCFIHLQLLLCVPLCVEQLNHFPFSTKHSNVIEICS